MGVGLAGDGPPTGTAGCGMPAYGLIGTAAGALIGLAAAGLATGVGCCNRS